MGFPISLPSSTKSKKIPGIIFKRSVQTPTNLDEVFLRSKGVSNSRTTSDRQSTRENKSASFNFKTRNMSVEPFGRGVNKSIISPYRPYLHYLPLKDPKSKDKQRQSIDKKLLRLKKGSNGRVKDANKRLDS